MPTLSKFRKRVHIAEITSDSSVELFADCLTIEVWSFLVRSLLVYFLLIVLSISWQQSLFDSIASLFWAEMALVS
jgi:hypothetical protein